jgi:hypothetical protein
MYSNISPVSVPEHIKLLTDYSLKDSILLINPNTMKFCDISAGRPCLVNDSYVLTAWPCSSVIATCVILPTLISNTVTGDNSSLVTVKRFLPSKTEAVFVTLQLE